MLPKSENNEQISGLKAVFTILNESKPKKKAGKNGASESDRAVNNKEKVKENLRKTIK